MRVSILGCIQTGNYTNKEGVKVYTTEVIVEEREATGTICILETIL